MNCSRRELRPPETHPGVSRVGRAVDDASVAQLSVGYAAALHIRLSKLRPPVGRCQPPTSGALAGEDGGGRQVVSDNDGRSAGVPRSAQVVSTAFSS